MDLSAREDFDQLTLKNAAVFLDFDGTLTELADTPDAVSVPEQLPQKLSQLYTGLNGALAIITGRDLTALDQFIDLTPLPASGSHGAEWRFADHIRAEAENALLQHPDITETISEYCRNNSLITENKGHSVTVHFRNRPDLEQQTDELLERLTADIPDLMIQKGKQVREVKSSSVNKAVAIGRFMSAAPWKGREPWYFGDDATDEDAFHWVNEHNGRSFKVGEGNTCARYRLASVEEVYALFNSLIQKGAEHSL